MRRTIINFSYRLRGQLAKLASLLLAGDCVNCKEYLSSDSQCLCDDCIEALPYLIDQCHHCAIPMKSASLCGNCQKQPPPFRRCIAAFTYQHPVDRLIQRIKTDAHAPEIKQLSTLLTKTVLAAYQQTPMPSIIIPLPLHWLKLTRRGFNQSLTIAQLLSAKLPNTKVYNHLCYRKVYARPQHLQGKRQRLRAVVGAFATGHAHLIQGKAVAVVDDVVTTGATAGAVATSLIAAGAASVDIWCIARTGWHIGSV